MSGPRLSITPAGAIFDRTLEPRDLHVLNLLGCYTDKSGWCRRSQVKMAVQLACGRASVQRSLERLVTAGWVEKKRPPYGSQTEQPSNSYMYRVVLDRDDFAFEKVIDEADESYAENALEVDDCPRVGTPMIGGSNAIPRDENTTEGAQQDGHPGAQLGWAPGAQPYVGTKNDPFERPLVEPIAVADDAPAREPLIGKSALDLAEQMLVIAGHDLAFWPPGWCGAPMRIQTWLTSGWPPEIILAATKGVMARKTGPPPASVQFFERAIAEEIARQNRPVPEISNVQILGDQRPVTRKGNAYARIAARLGRSG